MDPGPFPQRLRMKFLLLALLGAFSLSACAQSSAPAVAVHADASAASATATADPSQPKVAAGTPASRALAAVLKVNKHVHVDKVADAPLPGFQQVLVGGQVLYVSDDGRYLLQGSLYDIDHRRDLSEAAMVGLRHELLQSIPASDRITFAPANPKYTVTVFTDIECAYCRKFHSQIADYNREGIAVQYVAFPRMGLGSDDFKKMVAVWCAGDRRKALTDAKNDRPVPMRNCTNPVTMEFNMGQRMGLTGTPMVLAADGTQLGGYLPPDALRAALDKLAAGGKAPAASTATGAP